MIPHRLLARRAGGELRILAGLEQFRQHLGRTFEVNPDFVEVLMAIGRGVWHSGSMRMGWAHPCRSLKEVQLARRGGSYQFEKRQKELKKQKRKKEKLERRKQRSSASGTAPKEGEPEDQEPDAVVP